MNKKAFAKDLISFIDKSPTAYQAVDEMVARLEKAGFKRLDETKKWKLNKGAGYFVTRNDSAIIAFILGSKGAGYRIVGSHSDSPTFKIKPNPEMNSENHYIRLNTEKYGGAILSTWLDRPLSVAGRIMVKSDDPMNPKSIHVVVDKDLLIIPNMAIHMNRDVNDGYKFNAQVDTIPLMGIGSGSLMSVVAKAAGVKAEDIIGDDLFLYDRDGGKLIGLNEEFISVGRLDNLAMAHASIEALIAAYTANKGAKNNATAMVIVSDNEEVGSSSKQGAGSPFLKNICRRLCIADVTNDKSGDMEAGELYQVSLANSFLISADQAHAVHPNHTETHDPTNRPVMGKGVVIKHSANQKYITDADSRAVFTEICKLAGEKFQEFVNRSDKLGGSTIGPITSSQMDIRGLDIGNPILAMHSVRELGHVDDQFGLYKILKEYYKLC